MAAQNLWGEIPSAGNIRTPITILKEQAALLGQATNNVLQGDVTFSGGADYRTIFAGYTYDFTVTLFIVAPALDYYRFAILQVVYNINIYPLVVRNLADDFTHDCTDEASFLNAIKEILSSEETHRIIQTLLSQSQAA